MRGVLGGILAGAVVSVAVAVGLSVFVGPPVAPPPDVGMAEVPARSGFSQPPVDAGTTLPAPEPVGTVTGTPRVDAPEADDMAPLGVDNTETAAQPDTGAVEQALNAPAAQSEAAGMAAADPEEPVLPNPQAALPDAPETETRLSISTDPAQPPLPEAEPEQSAFPAAEPEAEPAPEAVTEEAAEPEAEVAAEVTAEAETEATQEASAEPATPNPKAADAPKADATAAEAPTEQPAAGQKGTRTVTLPRVGDAQSRPATPQAEAEEPPAPLGEEPQAAPEGRPAIGTPAVRLTERSSAISRLPSLGGDTGGAVDTAATMLPIKAFAAPFDNADGKPEMAIVLMDTGESAIGLEALSAFPYPISFAIDATRADAAEAMKKYRDAGFEVLAMADLPAGAQPRDAETVLNAAFAALPEAVGVMEGLAGGLQESRAVSDQVAGILAQTGHGLLLFPKGLNTAQKLAVKEGVPAATVFRDFDDKGQSADVIRRFLDNAAFKAGQEESGVIMVGRLRPDTISALLLWGLQDRASRVALAPVSQLLVPE